MSSTSRNRRRPIRGRADLAGLQRRSESKILRSSPPEPRNLPDDFWPGANVVVPVAKRAVSLRLDEDILARFSSAGPRDQSRVNLVLRSYMAHMRRMEEHKGRSMTKRRSGRALG